MADKTGPWAQQSFRERVEDNVYPLFLCAIRFVLSLTQFSVAIDTYVMLNDLNRMDDDAFDVSLTNIADTANNYDWVPVLPSDNPPSNYGNNKLFNLFIVTLVHFFRRQVGLLVLYPAMLSLIFMTMLSLFDLFEIFQSALSRSKIRSIGVWAQTVIYGMTFMLTTIQLVTLLYESSEISHMEIVYSFLFVYGKNTGSGNPMLLKTGVRSLKYRLVACIIFNLASLVPDTYLMLVRLLQPLRLYVIVNAMKVASSLICVGTFLMVCIIRYYVNASLDPKLLGDKTTLDIMKNNQLLNVQDYYPQTQWNMGKDVQNSSFITRDLTYLPVFHMGKVIDSRLAVTIEELKLAKHDTSKITNAPSSQEQDIEFEKQLAMYTFVQNGYAQLKTALDVFLYLSGYIAFVSFIFGMYGFVLVVKRHKLLLYVNFVVDVAALLWQLCNIIMTFYPRQATDFFCDAPLYLPGNGTLNFETNAVFTWMCRAKSLATLLLAVTLVQGCLYLCDVFVLYVLWR
ncbi:uncharacterized protein BXIN_2374 [Babesia sp. Xinjiang]|uniref:uncharacterized protein n=1 Tax=Babesia sp. Xinjiang TaxID=462227 RepID=UPI000A25AB24|nr:uncharacterized protein BXIN_2374 [Babesia sp. Xinjiang]ORM40705.1 hypothetical protein BXIN_2374 [Babesia sp. Xinjiang]